MGPTQESQRRAEKVGLELRGNKLTIDKKCNLSALKIEVSFSTVLPLP